MTKKVKKDQLSLDYLKESVYPDLHVALISLIDHVVKTDEVRKHQERLKKIKIFDKLEQKRQDKERLKAELGMCEKIIKQLGSDYESSEDSMDWEELGIDKEEVDKFMKKGGKGNEANERLDEQESGEQQFESDEIDKSTSNKDAVLKKKGTIESLGQIQEKDVEIENDDSNEKNELQRMKNYLKQQREEHLFNPLLHLSSLLRTVTQKKQVK